MCNRANRTYISVMGAERESLKNIQTRSTLRVAIRYSVALFLTRDTSAGLRFALVTYVLVRSRRQIRTLSRLPRVCFPNDDMTGGHGKRNEKELQGNGE